LNKDKYISLLDEEKIRNRIPVFALPSWLNAAAENWDVAIVEEHSKVTAALPYCFKGRLLTKRIYLPEFSFYQSPILFETLPESERQRIVHKLFAQLPYTVKSYFKFLPELVSLDLSSTGFKKESYETYMIRHSVEHAISAHHQRNINKGSKKQYVVAESADMQASVSLISRTFVRQKIKTRFTDAAFAAFAAACIENKNGQLMDCIRDGQLLASAFIAYDHSTIYYLFSGYDEMQKNSGAMTYLLHCLILKAKERQLDFNFCGSRKKSIAAFFEGFGAKKVEISIWKKGLA
jgi:hypothetical protein